MSDDHDYEMEADEDLCRDIFGENDEGSSAPPCSFCNGKGYWWKWGFGRDDSPTRKECRHCKKNQSDSGA